jgi:hypothetical protein
LTQRLKRFGVVFTLLGILAVVVATDYWSIDAVRSAPVAEAA